MLNYQVSGDWLTWGFNTKSQSRSDRDGTFPFVFSRDNHPNIRSSVAGPETFAFLREKKYVVFNDKYAVPANLGIGILFPKGFVPTIFKFVEQPVIPIGVPKGVTASPPGYFDIYYNRVSRQSAIVFMITSATYFEFRCTARYWEHGFPEEKNSYNNGDTLALTLNSEDYGKTFISSQDLMHFSNYFKPDTDLKEVQENLNELIDLLRNNQVNKNEGRINYLKSALSGAIFSVEFSSAIVQLMDSYYSGGVVQQLISKLLAYLIM